MALAFNNLFSGFLLLTLSFGLEAATIFRPDEECPCVEVAGCASMLGLTSKDGLIRSFPVCEYEELVRCCDDLTGLRKLRSSGRYSPPDPYLHGDRIPDEMKPQSVSGSERRGRLLELPPGIVEPRRVVYPEYIDPRTNPGSSSMTSHRGITGQNLAQSNVNPRSKLHNNFGPTSNDFLGRYDQSSFVPTSLMGVENRFGGNFELENLGPASMGMDSSYGQRHFIHISTKPEDGFQRYWIGSDGNAGDKVQGHFDEEISVPRVENSKNEFGDRYGMRGPLHIELPVPIAHLSWLRHSPRVENEGLNALPNNVGMLNYVQGNREDSKLRGNVRQTIPFVYPEYFDYRSVNRDRAQSVEPFTVSGQSNRVTPTPNIFLTPAKQEEPSKQTPELGLPNSTGETDRREEKKIGRVEVSGKVEASAEENPQTTKIFLIEDLPPAPSIPVNFGTFLRGREPSRNVGKSSENTNPEDGSSGWGQKQNKSMGNFQTGEPIPRDSSHPDVKKSHQARVVHKLDPHDGEMMDVEVAEALILLNNTEGKFGARLDEYVPHAEQKEAVESLKKQEQVKNEEVKQPLMSSDDARPKIDAGAIDRAKSVQVNNKISNSRLSALYGDGGRHHPSRKLVTPANRRFVQRTTLPKVNSAQRTKTVAKHESEVSMRRQFFGRQRARSVINGTSNNDESDSDQVIPRENPRPEKRESFQHFIRQRQKQTVTNAGMEKTVRDDLNNEATRHDDDELDDSARNVGETEGMQEADEHQGLEQEEQNEDDGQNERSIESLHREESGGLNEDEDENQSSEQNEPSFGIEDELEIEIEAESRHHEASDTQKQRKHDVEELDQSQDQAVEEKQLQGQVVEEEQGQDQVVEEEQGQDLVVEEEQRQGRVVEEKQLQAQVIEKKQGQVQVVEEEQRQGQVVEEKQGQGQVVEEKQDRGQVLEEEQRQGQVVEEVQSQGQVVEEKKGQGQVVKEEQGQGRVVEEQGQGRVLEEEQDQGRVVEGEQGQGRVLEEKQGQGRVVEEEQGQGQVVLEKVEEVHHSEEDQVRKNNEDEEPNLRESTIKEREHIEDEEVDENKEDNQGETEISGQNGGQKGYRREDVDDCRGTENQEHCRKTFEVGVSNPVQDDLETGEQMKIRNKHGGTEQIRGQGLSEQTERNEDGNERIDEEVVDDGKLIEMEHRGRNQGENRSVGQDENRKGIETILDESELRFATTTVYPGNVTLEIDSLSTERSDSLNREYSGERSDNLDNYRKDDNENVLSIDLERNENPRTNATTMIPVETEVREAETANNDDANVNLSNSKDFQMLSEKGVSLDQQNDGVHTTEVPRMVRGRKKMMRRRYGKRRRVVRKKLVTNETMESNGTHIEAKQSSGEFEAEQTRNEREQTNNEAKGCNDKMEEPKNEEKQKNDGTMGRTDGRNGSGSVKKQSNIAHERIEMNSQSGRKYEVVRDSKQTNVRYTDYEPRQKNVAAGKEENEGKKDEGRQKHDDNGQLSNEAGEQMKVEKEKRRKPLVELSEISPSDFEVLLSRGDARERESRQANSFALERQSGVESVTISPDELALPGRITVIGPIPKGFRDPAIISHEEEFGLELPTSNAGIFRQSGSAS